jgi:hypothetical protein
MKAATSPEVEEPAQELTMPFPCSVNLARIITTPVTTVLLAAVLLVSSSPAVGQQTYVTRYDAFVGYTFLDSPRVSLFENGAHFQFGVRPKTWYSLGLDYSLSAGDLTLTPNLLLTSLQQQLSQLLPPGYTLSVTSHSRTQTFAGGPQLSYRHYSKVTLFVRPSIGAIYERAIPHPSGEIATLIVEQLAPSGYKTDWTAFYGFGGGADLLFSKHVALRVQADLVYDHLFSELLKDGRLTTRFSIGPCFNFGKNIAK